MNRREMITTLALGILSAGVAKAHTPFSQWVVYRKKHLLIGAYREEPKTYELAKQIAASLGHHLPAAKSRVARAPSAKRLASLLGTDQLDVAVLTRDDAVAMKQGSGQFRPYGPIDLSLLADFQDYFLIAHERFSKRHAWLVSESLKQAGFSLSQSTNTEISFHPGADLFIHGAPEPHG